MNKFAIYPVGQGKFTILTFKWNGWKPFIIEDINPGYGGDEIHPMKASKRDCEKVLRFLNIKKRNKDIPTVVSWRLMDRVKKQLGVEFTYLHDYDFDQFKFNQREL